ncbi:MAG: malto-oligosyltrehalose trehalohydrolase [Syntrophobacteraceae bacterium]|nr:malto-oligosyltrehalose trehalohydrolase [Syntrophobacteraceae bacterium]
MSVSPSLGASPRDGSRCEFFVWAPAAGRVEVEFPAISQAREGSNERGALALTQVDRGYFHGIFEKVGPKTRYFYLLDGEKRRPDPASRFQPEGVHGPSRVMDPSFPWSDASWSGLDLRDYILYELHVGLFTPEGTFDGLIGRLDELVRLGVTAVELMPVGQFPGGRNWGYDGAYPFAAQNSYGGPLGLKRLVNACHLRGLAVTLDVVYNHLGPEGNYLGDFGPYFTDCYRTPWGMALNFDGAGSDEVRRFFIENALYWIEECHIDALRLDAVHAIVDRSARTFLSELSETVDRRAKRLNRRVYLFAESDRNEMRLIAPRELGGQGLDGHWNDDFHHSLHTVLTGENSGYYVDFGRLGQLAKAFREGFVYSGQYSAYRRRRHGTPSRGTPPERLVVFSQNHDQVGNRFQGERLSALVPFEALKTAAAAVILSPFTPLLFMGEEYNETAPFQYFVSHSDPALIEAVRKGRLAEFGAFGGAEAPDPQAEDTFRRCKLNRDLALQGNHNILLHFYTELLRLRKSILASAKVREVLSRGSENVLLVHLGGGREAISFFHFGKTAGRTTLDLPPGAWTKELDSAQKRWGGPGSRIPQFLRGEEPADFSFEPWSFAFFIDRKNS